MIHPTRTNLLILKEKMRSITGSIGILKARRQALLLEFFKSTEPFMHSREGIKIKYRKALDELHLSLGHHGEVSIESICAAGQRRIAVDIEQKHIIGVKYAEVNPIDTIKRSPTQRGYSWATTNEHVEEAIELFEEIVEAMMDVAVFESKMKKLGEEILRVTRRMRVLEERVMPSLNIQIKNISQYLSEREREEYFRLKRFKETQAQ